MLPNEIGSCCCSTQSVRSFRPSRQSNCCNLKVTWRINADGGHALEDGRAEQPQRQSLQWQLSPVTIQFYGHPRHVHSRCQTSVGLSQSWSSSSGYLLVWHSMQSININSMVSLLPTTHDVAPCISVSVRRQLLVYAGYNGNRRRLSSAWQMPSAASTPL